MIRHASLLAALAALVSGCAQAPLPAVPSVSTAALPTGAADKSLNATADGLIGALGPRCVWCAGTRLDQNSER